MPTPSMVGLNRKLTWITVAAMLLALVVPFLTTQQSTQAATVTARSIDMTSSQENVEASYTFSFDVPDNGAENTGSFIIEFCDNDPLPNTTCTLTSGDNVPDLDATDGTSATAATLNGAPTFNGSAISLTNDGAIPAGQHWMEFTLAAQQDIAATTTFSVTVDNIDNPENTVGGANNSFYARVYVYSTLTATAYANPVSTTNQNHEGGIALSTAEVITLDARVQETLNFCVGTIVTTDGDCSTVSGNSIDLGILDTATVTESDALDTTAGTAGCDFDDTDECAVLIVSTNATNAGVDVDYVTDAFDVALICSGGTASNAVTTDQCLNPAGTAAIDEGTEQTITAGSEAWGMAVVATTAHADTSTTNNLVGNIDADYDHATTGYAIDDGGTSIDLADSNNGTAATNVVDREQLELAFAATPSITTPSGSYQTTIVYIATSTF